jgi:hypothetical protein
MIKVILFLDKVMLRSCFTACQVMRPLAQGGDAPAPQNS